MIQITKEFPKTCTAHFVQDAFSKRCSGPDLNKDQNKKYDNNDMTLKTNVHGHNYRWLITFQAEDTQEDGMVIDFGDLKEIKQKLDVFDHAFVLWEKSPKVFQDFFRAHQDRLIIMKKNTTAENMARYAFKVAVDFIEKYNLENNTTISVSNAQVYETDGGSALASSADRSDILTYVHANEY